MLIRWRGEKWGVGTFCFMEGTRIAISCVWDTSERLQDRSLTFGHSMNPHSKLSQSRGLLPESLFQLVFIEQQLCGCPQACKSCYLLHWKGMDLALNGNKYPAVGISWKRNQLPPTFHFFQESSDCSFILELD